MIRGLSRCAGHPRAAVLSHRSIGHVRYYCGAKQEYQDRQRNPVPPHALLPFSEAVCNCRVSQPHDRPKDQEEDRLRQDPGPEVPVPRHDPARIERHLSSRWVLIAAGGIMPDTLTALFVLAGGAGFFAAMYHWVMTIAETIR